MIGSIEKDGIDSDTLTHTAAVHMLWEWRKYRNEVFWGSVYKLGAATIVISAVPYLIPGIIAKLGAAVIVFPLVTFLLAGFSSYLLVVLYKLYKTTDRRYRELLGKFTPADIQGFIFRQPIGKVIALAFVFYGVVIQLLSGFLLLSLANGTLP